MMMGGEFQLPEPIIQHIQSFLTGKEAAQTTVLSKSWYSAWLTRTNLELTDYYFNTTGGYYYAGFNYGFSEFAKKTIQRYEESNLTIQRLRLYMCGSTSMVDLASELIVRALKLGVTHLNLMIDYSKIFVLPHEVLECENLVELSLAFCEIDRNSIKCLNLESLRMFAVGISRDTIYNIISRCPLIQELELSCIHEIGPRAPCPTDIPKLCQLKCLVLCNVEFDTLWCFDDLLPKLTSLQDLTLGNCKNVRKVCSPSLERLTFDPSHRSRVEFDVPSIKKFTLKRSSIGRSVIPLVCFKSTSRKYWESHVSIKSYDPLNTSLFLELNQLINELSQSKIYLSLDFGSRDSFDYEVGDFEGLPKPQVENVTVDIEDLPSLNCYALFDGLFLLCRPRFITQSLLPESYRGAKENNDFVCKTLVQGLKGTCSFQSLYKYGLRDLEEVNVEIYDEAVPAWKPLPLESLLDASKNLTEEQKIRFQLKWNL
ncbi:hypothetical protein CASFOL_015830 [Castilleja foliolosa]|uniref:F-box/LRR-repeat protein 15/At3g58940/PEG3-like LRR domain-containing protein n=1 Tax=Castilleja foliolosa TaxID=1961234 RepID=A0ABD3DIN9_9LAMI